MWRWSNQEKKNANEMQRLKNAVKKNQETYHVQNAIAYTLHLNPKTCEVAYANKCKRYKVSGHQFLDVKRLRFDSNGICDVCNLLTG